MTTAPASRTATGRPTGPRPVPTARRVPRAATLLRFTWLLVVTAIVVFPAYVTVVTAFLPPQDVARGVLLPRRLSLDNVRTVLEAIPLGRQYLMSVLVTVLQTTGQVVTSVLAAYALVFPRWRGRAVAFAVIIATLAIPGDSLVIPNYTLVSELGLRDTVLGVAIPFLAAGYPIFLLRQAFLTLPREVWEAARLDGCGDLRCLLLVVLPMARPQLAAATLWSALAAWNGYFWPLLITDSPARRTVQVGISQLTQTTEGVTSPAVLYAGLALVLLPTFLLIIVGQRFLVRSLSASTHR